MTAVVVRGDARRLPLPDASVDLIVTSPPFWRQRRYEDGGEAYAGQIGSEATPGEYIAELVDCTREWIRVLKPSGSLWINLGDKYSDRANGGPSAAATNRSDRAAVRPPQPNSTAYAPPKSLLGLPWRYALACIGGGGPALADPDVVKLLLRDVAEGVIPLGAAERMADELAVTPGGGLGLILRAEVVWRKKTPLPESVTDRVARVHEQLFHLVRQPNYYSAVDGIREPHEAARRDSWDRRSPKVNGVRRPQVDARLGNNPLGKLPGSVWEVASEPLRVPDHLPQHFAMFPTAFPRRIIAGWSPTGICVECGEGRRPIIEKSRETYHGAGRWRSGRQQRVAGAAVVGWAMDEKWSTPVHVTSYACACPEPTAPVRPAVVLDPFGGSGTTTLVASALGRVGVTVDRSADCCRLAQWRTTDPGQRAKALGVDKPPVQVPGQQSLFGDAL
jgi:DNA modification methylase